MIILKIINVGFSSEWFTNLTKDATSTDLWDEWLILQFKKIYLASMQVQAW
jgi:hypothetical protein